MFPKIKSIETISCDASWRNYHFCKIVCEDGTVGWSEYDEGFGAPGVGYIINRLALRIVGQPVGSIETIYQILFAATRPASGGVTALAIAAIENAVLDAKAKCLNIPVYELLGGRIRDRLRVYWSHCATWRISRGDHYGNAITHLDGVEALGREVRERGFSALKTNIYTYDAAGKPSGWAPGFAIPFFPELNLERDQKKGLLTHLEALRSGAGPNVDILLDLNFHFRTEGVISLLRELAAFELFWVEFDTESAPALADIRSRSPFPIASCETILGLREFLPFFERRAIDVAIVDVVWNGAWQSMKIAAAAEAHQLNVAPHNFYGHLSTMMSVHFSAAVPNLKIVEIDIDRIANDPRIFTYAPEIVDGYLLVPNRPGWGTEPDEEYIRSIPPKSATEFAASGRKHVF